MKYQELAKILKDEIEAGIYSEKKKLPTEDNLMAQYQVSKYCVRNAINALVELGEVYPVQGSGMFVRESKREGCMSLGSTKGLTAEFPGSRIETKILTFDEIQATDEIARRMKCDIGTPLYFIVRLRELDEQPFSVEYTYYNKQIVPYLDRKIAEGSLFDYIRNTLGLSIGFADKVLHCEKLNEQVAMYFQLQVGDPTFVIEDDAYLSNGKMFNASKVYYHYQRTKFFDLAEMK